MKGMDYFDAVFLLPSGWGTMTEQQQKDLLAYVHDDGKGLIVGHAAGAAFNRADRVAGVSRVGQSHRRHDGRENFSRRSK